VIRSKGFTLIELIAVIAIIGIIALIATTTMEIVMNNASEQIFKSNEKLLATAAENYYKMNSELLPSAISEMRAVSLDVLIYEGYSKMFKHPKDADIVCNGYVVVVRTTAQRYEYRPYLSCGSDMKTQNYDNFLYLLP